MASSEQPHGPAVQEAGAADILPLDFESARDRRSWHGDAAALYAQVLAMRVDLELYLRENGTPRMLRRQILEDDPRPPRRLNDTIPPDLEAVCLKALAREPGRRHARAADLAADLRRRGGAC